MININNSIKVDAANTNGYKENSTKFVGKNEMGDLSNESEKMKTSNDENGLAEKKENSKLENATLILNKLLDKRNQEIEISRHDFFHQDVMMKIVDKTSGETIVEVPPKKILDMVAKLCEMAGILIDEKV